MTSRCLRATQMSKQLVKSVDEAQIIFFFPFSHLEGNSFSVCQATLVLAALAQAVAIKMTLTELDSQGDGTDMLSKCLLTLICNWVRYVCTTAIALEQEGILSFKGVLGLVDRLSNGILLLNRQKVSLKAEVACLKSEMAMVQMLAEDCGQELEQCKLAIISKPVF